MVPRCQTQLLTPFGAVLHAQFRLAYLTRDGEFKPKRVAQRPHLRRFHVLAIIDAWHGPPRHPGIIGTNPLGGSR